MPKASGSSSKSKRKAEDDTPMTLAPLLSYLQRSRGLSMTEAMRVAGPLLKNGDVSEASLASMDVEDYHELGIGAGEEGEALLKKLTGKVKRRRKTAEAPADIRAVVEQASKASGSGDKNWHRDRDLDQPLPDMDGERKPARRADVEQGDFDFDEELDEWILRGKKVLSNRAPVLLAWATVVCEQLNFSREEALSIGQAITSMNATAKGVAQGILPKQVEERAKTGSSQPYVQLLGRQVPVLSLQNGQWRGLAEGKIAEPAEAYGYLHRSLRQQMGALVGAMRLLASSFDVEELGKKAYGLYEDFRPGGQATLKWGQKEEVQISTLLDLRPELKDEDEKPEIKDEDFDALLDDDLDIDLLAKVESE